MFNLRTLLLSAIVILLAVSVNKAQDKQSAPNQAAQNLYMEYMQIQMDIQGTQQKALEDEKLSAMRDKFTDLIDSEMKKLGKDVAKLVDEKNAKIEAFNKVKDGGNDAEIQAKAQDVKASIDKLQEHEQKVLQLENVSKLQNEFQSAMIEKMMELDPQLQNKIMRLQQIQAQLSQGQGN